MMISVCRHNAVSQQLTATVPAPRKDTRDHGTAGRAAVQRAHEKRHVVGPPVEEELDCLGIQLEGDRLHERDIEPYKLLVVKVKLVRDQAVEMVLRQHVVDVRVVLEVLKHDGQRLQQLALDVFSRVLEIIEEKLEDIILKAVAASRKRARERPRSIVQGSRHEGKRTRARCCCSGRPR